MEIPISPAFLRCKLSSITIDQLIEASASVAVARQLGRASLLAAVVASVLAPPFTVVFLWSRGIAPDSFTMWASALVSVLALAFAAVVYPLLYRGSRRLLKLMTAKLFWRVSMFCTWMYFLVPVIMLWYVPREPLLILYVAALALSVMSLIYFLRWSRKIAADLRDAFYRFPAEIFYSPIGGATLSFMFREVFSLPPGYLVKKKRIAKILFLSIIAMSLEGLSVAYILQQNQNLNYASKFDLRNMATLTAHTTESHAEIITSAVITAVFPLLSVPILIAGGRIRQAARRAAIYSVLDVRTVDQRPPLVFLRSFANDQVSVSPVKTTSIFFRSLVQGSVFLNIDQMLTERYWNIGPVFAIGKPTDSLPPLGAAREYLRGEDWKTVVDSFMREARAIILTLDETQGVLWELGHAREIGVVAKCLLLVPPHRHGDVALLRTAFDVLNLFNA